MSLSGKRVSLFVVGAVIIAATASALLPLGTAYATGQLTVRSLTLQTGVTDGASKPGGVVNHLFGFTIATTANIGSIQFLYCTTAAGTCTLPTGLVTTSATMGAETGATGFTLVNATNGAPYITRSAASLTSTTAVTEQLLSVTNPTTTNLSFYVRITTFTSIDATTGATDLGVVAASTATQITLTGTMPESLIFCTGGTVTVNGGGIPDCSTATSGAVSFNQLFSPADTATATSQMAASTNADNGYSITYAGTTLTSGSNTVNTMHTLSTGDLGTRGLSQFGLNLRTNTTTTSTPAVGTNVAPAANGTNFKGQPVPSSGYDSVDHFRFVTGESVANSANGGTPGPTDAQIFTVSYMVNVSGGQPVGTYTTTLTYVCTATF
jgi:hypothetical protein